jgi:hypothetical protein
MRNIIARTEVWYDPVDMDDPMATVVPGDASVLEYAYGLDVPEELVRWGGGSFWGLLAWFERRGAALSGGGGWPGTECCARC